MGVEKAQPNGLEYRRAKTFLAEQELRGGFFEQDLAQLLAEHRQQVLDDYKAVQAGKRGMR